MRWVITSAKELRDGVFTEGEIPPHNLKAMNFKTLLQHGMQQERHPLKRGRGALGQKRLIERSFEHDQIPQSLETEKGLNRLNPKAVDPSSLDRFNPKAVELDQEDNTSMPELPTFSPTLGHNIPNNPIEDEILEPVEQLGLNPEDLNANDLLDQNDFSNVDNFLDQMENLVDVMQEITSGGTHNGNQDHDAADEANWSKDDVEDMLNHPDSPKPNFDPTEDNGAGGDDDANGGNNHYPDENGSQGGGDENPGEDGSGDGIMSTGNEDGSPPWVNHLDDITGQEDVIPEVSNIEIPLYEFTNHLQKSSRTINRSQEFLTKDGVINHDHTSVTMNSAFADNGEFIIEAIPSVGETYRAEGLSIIPHIQAKNFSELIPTITIDTIQDI